MRLRFRIKESVRDISKKIIDELRLIAAEHLTSKLTEVQEAVKPIIYNSVYHSPEMRSCREDYLKAEFGLDFDPTIEISRAVSESVLSRISRASVRKDQVIGSMQIEIQPNDYINVLSIPEAVVITEDGAKLPWLSWLTLYGNSIIILDYGIRYEFGTGRSGLGYMRKKATPYRVHPSYSGDATNNFITRAINSAVTIDQITTSVGRILSR